MYKQNSWDNRRPPLDRWWETTEDQNNIMFEDPNSISLTEREAARQWIEQRLVVNNINDNNNIVIDGSEKSEREKKLEKKRYRK